MTGWEEGWASDGGKEKERNVAPRKQRAGRDEASITENRLPPSKPTVLHVVAREIVRAVLPGCCDRPTAARANTAKIAWNNNAMAGGRRDFRRIFVDGARTRSHTDRRRVCGTPRSREKRAKTRTHNYRNQADMACRLKFILEISNKKIHGTREFFSPKTNIRPRTIDMQDERWWRENLNESKKNDNTVGTRAATRCAHERRRTETNTTYNTR